MPPHRINFRLSILMTTALMSASLAQITTAATIAPDCSASPTACPGVLFLENQKDISFESKFRRKWESPVVADLDQDGYPDLLLTDHGWAVKLFWNNKGKYAAPIDLTVGDTHGIAVGDYNHDGKPDVMITRGGGSGASPRVAYVFTFGKDRKVSPMPAFSEPMISARGRTAKWVDTTNTGKLDLFALNFPGLTKVPDGENYLYANNGSGDLTFHSKLPQTPNDGERTLITDINNDGHADFLLYGSTKPLSAYVGKGDRSFTDVSKSVLPADIQDVTDVAEIDYDNDGDFDLIVTRGHDLQKGETFYDPMTKTMAFFTLRQSTVFPDFVAGDVLKIQNLQSPWPDQEVMRGEPGDIVEWEGDKHAGRNLSLNNSDTLGFPEVRDKKGVYVGFVGNHQWRIGVNSFSEVSGVVTGVKAYPAFDHQAGVQTLLLENRGGKFVDVTDQSGINLVDNATGVTVGDFDNNGYQDILIVRRGNLATGTEEALYLNQGNGKFIQASNSGLSVPDLGAIGQGVESLDFDMDGRLDFVFGLERGAWHLFKGTSALGTTANYIKINVGNSPSGKGTAQGALVNVKGCGQTHSVHVGSTGGGYNQSLDNMIHVGLGACTTGNRITVKWSTGEAATLAAPTMNTIYKLGR
ncbi:MAG: CRTAC1 family protein [Asticcacaulis sp.]